MAGTNGGGSRPPDHQRESARSLLESVVKRVAPDATVPLRSTDYGPEDGSLGFSYRDGSLMVEYQTRVNAADTLPETTGVADGLVELTDHTSLSAAGDPYDAVERSVIEDITETVPAVPDATALEPVTAWPVAGDPGLYRVGFEAGSVEFLYAVAFRIPPSALE